MSADALGLDRELQWMLEEEELGTEALVQGLWQGAPRIGLVIKRSYTIGMDGMLHVVADEDAEPVCEQELPYYQVDPPFVPPVRFGCDTFCFRPLTDLVIQGSCFPLRPVTEAIVGFQLGNIKRQIKVYGDRRIERSQGGQIRFSKPEPFESMPIRYDFAYGGYDLVAASRYESTEFEELKQSQPDSSFETISPFHYQRNLAGQGFLIDADPASFADVIVPNLEFPFDPLNPQRLAVSGLDRWLSGPLPAGMDWVPLTCFPRIGYFGYTPRAESYHDRVEEYDYGWAAKGLHLREPFHFQADASPDSFFAQAASPGMSFKQFPPDAQLTIHNMCPMDPVRQIRLSGEVPIAKLQLAPNSQVDLEPHLIAVVIRPAENQVVMTWCAHASGRSKYTPAEIRRMNYQVEWRQGTRGAGA